MKNNQIHLRVWGDWACFTRPEMKVERVSYPVMTPSAARGVLEAVFWEPQVCYHVAAIRVVRRGSWASIRRNEVTAVISLRNAGQWMREPEKFSPIQAGGGAPDGTQRNMLALQQVEYIISAELRTTPLADREGDTPVKYLAEFKRRAQQGKCFHRPALGMREFAADFEWVEDPQATLEERAAELSKTWRYPEEDLGLILYDVFPPKDRAKGFRWKSPAELGPKPKKSIPRYLGELAEPRPCFFRAKLKDSTLACHPNETEILESQGA
ncbi:type I-C CRISPR-associated protein Cas5c [bacterium]|nr:type I-C CRISPR-associated protein Cas5c [bacterium]